MIAKAEGDEVLNGEESRTNRGAGSSSLEGSVVRAAGDVSKRGNQLSGTVEGGVLQKQISEEIETASFEVRGSVNSRGRGHK
jgi:hypothetical protein